MDVGSTEGTHANIKLICGTPPPSSFKVLNTWMAKKKLKNNKTTIFYTYENCHLYFIDGRYALHG